MRSRRMVVTASLTAGVAGVVAAVVATTTQPGMSADATTVGLPSTGAYRGPVASASGDGGGAVMYPSLVDVHLDRAYAAMSAAETAADAGKPRRAAASIRVARSQALAAWKTTQYVIRTTPPRRPRSMTGRVREEERSARHSVLLRPRPSRCSRSSTTWSPRPPGSWVTTPA